MLMLSLLYLLCLVAGETFVKDSGLRAGCFFVSARDGQAFLEVELRSSWQEPLPVFIVAKSLIPVYNVPETFDYDEVTFEEYSLTVPSTPTLENKLGILENKLANLKRYLETADANTVTKERNVMRKIDVTGFYCVYIAPTIDVYDVATVIKHGHGYLSTDVYVQLKLQLWGIPSILAFIIVLFRKLIPRSVQELDSTPVVIRGALLLYVFPWLVADIWECVVSYFENSAREPGTILVICIFISDKLSDWAIFSGQIVNLYFCLGYGVIYYHRPTRYLREMPKPKKRLGYIIGILGLFSTSVLLIIEWLPFYSVIMFIIGIEPFFVYVLMVVQSFKTKKELQKFPLYTSTVEDEQSNIKLSKAFNRSVIVVLGLPIFFAFWGYFIPPIAFELRRVAVAIATGVFEFEDEGLKEHFKISCAAIVNIVYWWVYIGAVYFIWAKDNLGIVADQVKDAATDVEL